MRIGILAIQHESNTFASKPTTIENFRTYSLHRGEELREYYVDSHHEIAGYLQALAEARFEAVPLFAARAMASGTLSAEAADELIAMAMEQLGAAGHLDALLLGPHGAAVSEQYRDFDGHWLSLVREFVGPGVPLVGTMDPHANVSDRMVQTTDALLAYRANPHIDQEQVGLAAGRLLVRTLKGQIKPVQRIARPNVSISIDRQETASEPCSRLVALTDAMLTEPGILANSLVLGFPYADVQEMGSSFIVVADDNADLAQRKADELAQYLHRHRHDYACGLPDVAEAIRQAIASRDRVCLLDVGDNVGGGAPADGTVLAHALHEARVPDCFVCLFDPSAVAQAQRAGRGARLTLTMGGHTDDRHGKPFTSEVLVCALTDGHYSETQVRHGGATRGIMGPTAVVRTPRGMTLMLTSIRTAPFSLQQLIQNAVNPQAFHILVAKGVNAPLAAYKPVCPRCIRVNTPGVTCADARQFPFRHRHKPLFPFEDTGS